MVHISCAVVTCWRSRGSRHRFPNPHKNFALLKQWVELCGNKRLLEYTTPDQIFRNCRVCSLHFKKEDFGTNNRLLRTAIPSLLLPDKKIEYTVDWAPTENTQPRPVPSVIRNSKRHDEKLIQDLLKSSNRLEIIINASSDDNAEVSLPENNTGGCQPNVKATFQSIIDLLTDKDSNYLNKNQESSVNNKETGVIIDTGGVEPDLMIDTSCTVEKFHTQDCGIDYNEAGISRTEGVENIGLNSDTSRTSPQINQIGTSILVIEPVSQPSSKTKTCQVPEHAFLRTTCHKLRNKNLILKRKLEESDLLLKTASKRIEELEAKYQIQ